MTPDEQRQQRRQQDVLAGPGLGEGRQRAEREQRGERRGPGLQVRRRGEEGGRDQGQRAGVQPDVGRHPGDLGVGERLRDEHQCHRTAGETVGEPCRPGGRPRFDWGVDWRVDRRALPTASSVRPYIYAEAMVAAGIRRHDTPRLRARK